MKVSLVSHLIEQINAVSLLLSVSPAAKHIVVVLSFFANASAYGRAAHRRYLIAQKKTIMNQCVSSL